VTTMKLINFLVSIMVRRYGPQLYVVPSFFSSYL
jgi:hypothetical protein